MSDEQPSEKRSKYQNSLIEELARAEADKQALIQEFSNSLPKEWSPDDLKEKVTKLMGKAFARVAKTIDDDLNPALAYKAAKDVIDIGIGRVVITDANDPDREIKELLKSLKPQTEVEKVLDKVKADHLDGERKNSRDEVKKNESEDDGA